MFFSLFLIVLFFSAAVSCFKTKCGFYLLVAVYEAFPINATNSNLYTLVLMLMLLSVDIPKKCYQLYNYVHGIVYFERIVWLTFYVCQ